MSEKNKEILVATTNPGKIAEMRAMLGGGVRWLGLADIEQIEEIEEDGATFAANARKNAGAAHQMRAYIGHLYAVERAIRDADLAQGRAPRAQPSDPGHHQELAGHQTQSGQTHQSGLIFGESDGVVFSAETGDSNSNLAR